MAVAVAVPLPVAHFTVTAAPLSATPLTAVPAIEMDGVAGGGCGAGDESSSPPHAASDKLAATNNAPPNVRLILIWFPFNGLVIVSAGHGLTAYRPSISALAAVSEESRTQRSALDIGIDRPRALIWRNDSMEEAMACAAPSISRWPRDIRTARDGDNISHERLRVARCPLARRSADRDRRLGVARSGDAFAPRDCRASVLDRPKKEGR